MERLWRLYRNRSKTGNFNQQDPAIFYLHIYSYDGVACYYLYGTGFLEKYAKIYLGGKEKSLVLFIDISNKEAISKVDEAGITMNTKKPRRIHKMLIINRNFSVTVVCTSCPSYYLLIMRQPPYVNSCDIS